MKTNAIIRIIVYSVVILVLLGILAVMLLVGSNRFSPVIFSSGSEVALDPSEEAPYHRLPSETEVSFSPGDIHDIEIEWAAGSILIMPYDGDEIHVSESDVSDEKYAMHWKNRNGTLSIQFNEEGFHTGFGISISTDISKDLTILVPRDWVCDSLEIDAASAKVEVSELVIGNVEFDGASGRCEFRDCVVDSLDLDTASGDVEFYGMLNILDCDAASANITAVVTNIPNRMNMDTMSGDLDITLPTDCGFTVTMDGLDTDLTSDFTTTVRNGSYVAGNGSCRIDLNAMSGDITIRKGESEAVPFGE